MRDFRSRSIAAVSLIALAASASACLLPRSPKSSFYTLTRSAERCASKPSNLRVGLGPLSFPGYLEQSKFATRVDPTRVEYLPEARWAGPLNDQFTRVLAADLAQCLGTEQIVTFPWYPNTPLAIAVQIDVLAFEVDQAGTAHLSATWSVRHPHTDEIRRSSSASLSEPARAPTMDAKVEALSRTVAQLAQRIAADLRRG